MIRRADGCVPQSAQDEEIAGGIEAVLRARQTPRLAGIRASAARSDEIAKIGDVSQRIAQRQ
jgi:hypothetical protein